MKLPNGERAVVELEKLTHYVLDPSHPRGKHKARVFEAVLGLTVAHAPTLRAALLAAAANNEGARSGEADGYGQRYVLDFPASGPKGTAVVRSAWIVRAGETFPRFTTCHVL